MPILLNAVPMVIHPRLWGRDDAVKFLLEKGAEPWMIKGRTALDLAQDSGQNRAERGARSCTYRETQDLRMPESELYHGSKRSKTQTSRCKALSKTKSTSLMAFSSELALI